MRKDSLLLRDMVEAIQRIQDYTSGGEKRFLADIMAQDAVLRNLEVLGEAAKGISEELRAAHPGIPWRRIAGLRDKLIHDYAGVELRLVWGAVVQLAPLKDQLIRLLTELP